MRHGLTSLVARGLVSLGFLSLGVIAVEGWETDVHFGLTRWLAIQAGFSPDEADDIARGDQELDDSTVLSPIVASAISCLKPDLTTANTVHDGHFASPRSVRRAPADRAVQKGEVWNRFQSRVAPPQTVKTRSDREDLGAFLHALQDSWSHGGTPDVPPRELCDPDYSWGHPYNRGGWTCHLADLTYYWPNDVQAMAQATFEVLAAATGQKKVWTPAMADAVRQFAALKDKRGKREWFRGQQFSNLSFTSQGSLPECLPAGSCAPESYADRVARWLRSKVGLDVEADIPREVVQLIDRFVSAMGNPDGGVANTLDVGLATLALRRSLNVTEPCPALLDKYTQLMLLDGFRNGYGARQPLLICEIAIKNQGKAPTSCQQALSAADAALAARERYGPTLSEMVDKLGRQVPPYRGSITRTERGYAAILQFVHLDDDVLLLTTTDKTITGFQWVTRR